MSNFKEQRLRLKGRLVELRGKIKETEAFIAADLIVINQKADPYTEDLSLLNGEVIAAAAARLQLNVEKLKELNKLVADIEADLGTE